MSLALAPATVRSTDPGPPSAPGNVPGSVPASPPAPVPGLPADWPLRAASRTVVAGGLRWHVQRLGPREPGPDSRTLLLLHGTGASTHSLADLAEALAARHEVVVPDLPGHGFTQRPASSASLSLPGMAAAIGALLRALDLRPALVLGHSAGAAIGARLCLDGHAAPHTLASLNGAWFPPDSIGAWWYAPAARLLARNPLVPHLFAWQAARPATLRKLIDSTGSRLDEAQCRRYGFLVSDPAHVGAVLAMMAAWDLRPLLDDLPRLQPRLALAVGGSDGTVPPAQALSVRALCPGPAVQVFPGLGHLAHEEDPDAVSAWVAALMA